MGGECRESGNYLYLFDPASVARWHNRLGLCLVYAAKQVASPPSDLDDHYVIRPHTEHSSFIECLRVS